ncbi:MAG: DNA replication/repair protein RecF [Mangrovibacterium sp.]
MYLEHLSLVNFKNLEELDLRFSPGLNCFIGNNGAGKTNLMDAVYYLSFCKSFLNPVDSMNIRHHAGFFVIQGKYRRLEQEENIYCGVKNGEKKHFKRNRKEYKRLSGHIGLLPLVIVTPSDTSLITGGSEDRRKFLDALISQYDAVYLDQLIRYNRALQQRNIQLKQFASGNFFSRDMLEVWDEQIIRFGKMIHEKRVEYILKLEPVFQQYYELISGGREKTGLHYQSQLTDDAFENLMQGNMKKDCLLQYTTAGIHKDDIRFALDEHPLKKLGSEGQKKTYLVALRLAQYDFIKQMSGLTPLLLLDDIFDKLDKHRVKQLIGLVANDHFGQIFITDTNREHLDQIIREVSEESSFFTVNNGKVEENRI